MGIPIGSKVTCTLSAATLKVVECKGCGESFVYRMERRANGYASNLLWLDGDGARERATKEAEKQLEKALIKGCDFVPCPGCGWYQPDMVQRKRTRIMCWSLAGVVVVWIGGAITIAAMRTPFSSLQTASAVLKGLVIAGAMVAVVAPWLMNLNKNAAARIEKARANPQVLTEQEVEQLLSETEEGEAMRQDDAELVEARVTT